MLSNSNRKRLYVIYGILLIAILCLLAMLDVFQQANHVLSDQMFRWRGEGEPRTELAIVAISEEDFEQGAPRWPWPRSLMARLIDQISANRPTVIAIDILYTERSNTDTVFTRERFSIIQPYLYQILSGREIKVQSSYGTQVVGPGTSGFEFLVSDENSAQVQDMELAAAVRRAVDDGVEVIMAAQTVSGTGVRGLNAPYAELSSASDKSVGLVGIQSDGDGVLRRYIPYGRDDEGGFIYGLALEGVARLKGVTLPTQPLRNGDVPIGGDLLVKVSGGSFLVNFNGPPGTYPTWSAGEILRGEEDLSEKLNGKIVFVGITDASSEDLHPTPFSGSNRMAGVEFQAAAADMILSGSYIGRPSDLLIVLLLIVLGLVSVYLGRFARPLYGSFGAVIILMVLVGCWLGAFIGVNYLVPISELFVLVLLGYTLALIDRSGIERMEKQQAETMLSRYLSPDVVKEVLRNPINTQLMGRRVNVTVLFSDIRGFTSLSEKLDPEEVVELLNMYLTAMTEIIFRYGGTVDKFEGDAILAFFGAPKPYEDQGERAVRTAIEMRDRLSELQEVWKEKTDVLLRIGVGIHSGEVMVGNIGSRHRMDYTVIGDTVNLAARLQDLTKTLDAAILISGTTRSMVAHMCHFRELGPVEVRGRQQAVEICEVVDLSD